MKYQISENANYKSIEIAFDGKPSEAVREVLKAFRFRWHGARRVWYGYASADEVREAIEAADRGEAVRPTKEKPAPRQSLPPELLEEVREIYSQEWSGNQKMIDYCVGKISDLVKLSNGFIIEIEKRNIEKDFCFGYGYQGMTEEEANSAADHAGKSQEYFKRENMKDFRRWLEYIDGGDPNGWAHYTFVLLDRYDEAEKLKVIRFCRVSELLDALGGSADLEAVKGTFCTFEGRRAYIPTDEDRAAIRAGYVSAMDKHEKKIDAYLKRYGLAHVNSWSYWADA